MEADTMNEKKEPVLSRILTTWFWMMILWLLLTWTLDRQFVIIGLVSSLIASLVFYDFFIVKEPSRKLSPRRLGWLIAYIPKFTYEIILANLDVAYRVLHPKMPINPGIVKVNTKLKRDTAITALANSITLTPGTMTVDCDEDEGYLYIHWINVKTMEPEKIDEEIPGRFERWLERIFE
jgi:multicomponent Na+:H+ antiporter subunit E